MTAKTTINDVWGKPHEYSCEPLGYDESMGLKLRLGLMVIRPVVSALGATLADAIATLGGDAEDPAAGVNLADLGAVLDQLDGMDFGTIGKELASSADVLLERLIAAGGAEFIAEILAGTTRRTPDAEQDHLKTLDLSKPLGRTRAYSGGNQIESYRAIKWILAVNYAPFMMGESGGLPALWAALKG